MATAPQLPYGAVQRGLTGYQACPVSSGAGRQMERSAPTHPLRGGFAAWVPVRPCGMRTGGGWTAMAETHP